ncbi:hypothetical protein ACFYOC_14785 [Nocardiopsis alba]|uniref:hypothetical protein n=1 Tax=Nocardiopsis alba TaxID=53437 RepID=UPI0036C38DF4
MQRLALPSAALLALLAASACGTGGTPAEDRTANIAEADTEAEPADEAEDSPSEVEVDLGGTYEFDDGLVIELSGVERGVSGEWAYPENMEHARFTIQIQNGTGGAVDLTMFYLQCQYGEEGRTGETIHDTDQGLGDGFTGTVMADRSATADFGCELPSEESYLQVEVNVGDETETDWMRPTVYFVGDV